MIKFADYFANVVASPIIQQLVKERDLPLDKRTIAHLPGKGSLTIILN